MKKTIYILLIITTLSLSAFGQTVTFQNLFGGKWKYQNLPDSTKSFDGSLNLCPSNTSFWFKDSSKVDVVWNGFYFKDKSYFLSKSNDLLFVHIDSTFENVSAFSCILKPKTTNSMKLQYSAFKKGELKWNENETEYNTNNIYLFNFKPK